MNGQILNPLTGLPIEDAELATLSDLVSQQLNLEAKVKNAEETLSELKKDLETVSTRLIPQKLDALGLSEIKTADGHKVTVKPFYSTKILTDAAFKWLDENGYGGIIQTEVSRKFSREQREQALEYQKNNPGFMFKESVHHQTLAAFTREIYSDAGSLPDEYFQVFQGAKTKIS